MLLRMILAALMIVLTGVPSPVASAQPATRPATRSGDQTLDVSSSGSGMNMGSAGQGPSTQMDKMDKMADAMTAMAQMCQTMMQREDRTLRYGLVAACVVGAFLLIALVLFIVLEVQWIRFFGLRIRAERRRLSASAG